MIDKTAVSRRIALASIGAGAAGAGVSAMAQGRPPVDLGTVLNGKVLFPPPAASSEVQPSPPRNADAPTQRVGFAIVGLGKLALEQVMPAFAQAKHARPVALVSGSPDKMQAIAAQYGIAADACYSYADMAKLRDNPAVQVVYVITPNALHRQHVVAAARAGKHVLCEKPMAPSLADCHAMIEACRAAGVKLMIAYRMQYQPHAREAIRLARSGALGAVTLMDMINNQNQGDPAQWRQIKALAGGGSLPDVGLYCLNTARAVLGEEPIEVSAQIWSPPGDPRFREVEDNVTFSLRFPSGAIANCMSSYSTHRLARLTLMGSDASATMEHAFDYQGQTLRVSRLTDGKEQAGEIGIEPKNQFALELDHMAQCVRQNITPRTPGEEGAQDQRIMEAIYEAARTGQRVRLAQMPGLDRFRGPEPTAE
ncbi:Gfo/Idh/MocA family protein [Novosphingobium sp.]|uniref:Gfo/Idh/MocA family protein n=1 Tax=Novosphingobium sp. TaxID=1874826 RepID=UPI003B5185C9